MIGGGFRLVALSAKAPNKQEPVRGVVWGKEKNTARTPLSLQEEQQQQAPGAHHRTYTQRTPTGLYAARGQLDQTCGVDIASGTGRQQGASTPSDSTTAAAEQQKQQQKATASGPHTLAAASTSTSTS